MDAEMLVYLIEVDTELQRIASISDHLIQKLSLFLKEDAFKDLSNATETKLLKQAALSAGFSNWLTHG